MRRPALSPAAPVPAPLVAALVTFDDEAEPIEDVEIAGSKVPFSALAKIFGQPAIQIRGSFDAVEPMGLAFSAINSYNGRADDFVRHAIRMGVPAVQRSDLRDFAYDVVRKASSAYAVI